MLASYFLINFPLIDIFFFLDQSNIPIIFINKEMKLQYLNIEQRDFDIWTNWFWFLLMVRYNVWILHSQLGLSCEWIMKSSLSKTLQIPAFASHVACFASWHSRASREILIFTKFSSNSHTQPFESHKIAVKWLNIITIKFNMELKPIKNIVVNHNLQNSWL